MQDQFNQVSLANLSKAELLAMLANLQSQFNSASSDAERDMVHAKIEVVKRALMI